MEILQWFIAGATVLIMIKIESAEKKIVAEMRRIENHIPAKEDKEDDE